MLSLVVGDKTNHLRMLVVKQKTCTKKKKTKLNKNSQIMYQSCNRNNNFSGYNSYDKRMSTKTNNYNSISQNTRHDYHRSNNSSLNSNQLKQSCSSFSKSYSDLKNDFNQISISSTGYVTDKLRSDIESYMLENQMVTFYIILIHFCQLSHDKKPVIY